MGPTLRGWLYGVAQSRTRLKLLSSSSSSILWQSLQVFSVKCDNQVSCTAQLTLKQQTELPGWSPHLLYYQAKCKEQWLRWRVQSKGAYGHVRWKEKGKEKVRGGFLLWQSQKEKVLISQWVRIKKHFFNFTGSPLCYSWITCLLSNYIDPPVYKYRFTPIYLLYITPIYLLYSKYRFTPVRLTWHLDGAKLLSTPHRA